MQTTIYAAQANQFINDLQEYIDSCREPISHLCVDFPFYDRIRESVENLGFWDSLLLFSCFKRWKKAGFPNTKRAFLSLAYGCFYYLNANKCIREFLISYAKTDQEKLDVHCYVDYLEIVAEIEPIIRKLKTGAFCGQPLLLSEKEADIIYTYLN